MMALLELFLLPVLVGMATALSFTNTMQYGASCNLKYGDVMTTHDWVCRDSQFQAYPTSAVNNLLYTPVYLEVQQFLNATRGCGQFTDAEPVYGSNEYYSHESVCKMVRTPIRVLWYNVPAFSVPANLMGLNGGKLPVHVLEGQNLFDVECFHPWSKGIPKHIPSRMASRLSRIRWDEVKERLCLSGYTYNYNLVCKPTGYMEREVYVYSEHANKIFPVVVPDVPTYCACSYCNCHKKG